MIFFIASILLMNLAMAAEQKPDVGSPTNAVSRGKTGTNEISDSPTGTTKQEQKAMRSRNESMGGAPNVGAGMGTGTGAGSTVGNKIKTE